MKKFDFAIAPKELAYEIRKFMIENGLWEDVRIYFNGKCLSTSDESGHHYNELDTICLKENVNPRDYVCYVGDIFGMSFEGVLYGCMNNRWEYGYRFDEKIQRGLSEIFMKYGCYYKLGNHWNLSLYLI